MKNPLVAAIGRVSAILDALSGHDRREAAVFIFRNYGGTVLEADRQKQRRDRTSERLHSDEPTLLGGANGTGALADERDDGRDECRDALRDGVNAEAVSSQTLLPPSQEKQDKGSKNLELIEQKDREFLQQCPEFYKQQWLDGDWWVSLKDAYSKLNLQTQASQYLANELAKTGTRHKNVKKGLRNWCAKSEYWRERKEPRR